MERRAFLRLAGAASIAPTMGSVEPKPPDATILFEDRATPLANVHHDPKDAGALWIPKRDLPRVNGFEVKPEGACRADICIPVPKSMLSGDSFNLTAFAKKVGEVVVSDAGARVWSFGEIQALRGGFLNSRIAPDVTIPDRGGRPVALSSFRGRKVLLLTWASW
jgi:hypothetical protein